MNKTVYAQWWDPFKKLMTRLFIEQPRASPGSAYHGGMASSNKIMNISRNFSIRVLAEVHFAQKIIICSHSYQVQT